MLLLRWLGPLALAVIATAAIDQITRARRLDPPGFAWLGRRVVALLAIGFALYLGVFASLGQIGLSLEVDFESIATPELFFLHAILIACLGVWFALGFAGTVSPGTGLGAVAARQLGFSCANPFKEIGIGLGLGLLVWPALIATILLVALVLIGFGGDGLLPEQPPGMIVWIAALPVPVRLLIALSAGVVEETFFRGFLQPRVGVALSSLLFVLAHLSYDEPFMLVGITLLSLFFAGLVRWRQNLWAAITAHFLFDAVQLLIVIPWALGQIEQGPSSAVAALIGGG